MMMMIMIIIMMLWLVMDHYWVTDRNRHVRLGLFRLRRIWWILLLTERNQGCLCPLMSDIVQMSDVMGRNVMRNYLFMVVKFSTMHTQKMLLRSFFVFFALLIIRSLLFLVFVLVLDLRFLLRQLNGGHNDVFLRWIRIRSRLFNTFPWLLLRL